MEFRILGVPEVWHDGRRVPTIASKQLAVLVTGLLSANRVVSVDRFVDAVWADDPPRTAVGLIQTYVSLLRRSLAAIGGDGSTIVTRPPGYLVAVAEHELDLNRFDTLVAEGRRAAREGHHDTAAATLREALAVWRGPALDGLTTPLLRNEARHLDDTRLTVVEERIAADLARGRPDLLTAELGTLVAAHPLRERLRVYQMRALYRLGRQAEALDAYRAAAHVLRTELGIDPGPDLQAAHRAILSGDPTLQAPEPPAPASAASLAAASRAAAPASAPPASPRRMPRQRAATSAIQVPSQLPPAVADLTGRTTELAQLSDGLAAAADAAHPTWFEITGRAGGGKTALAVTAAQAVRDAFPDGHLFAVMRDPAGDSAARTAEVLAALLHTFGVDPSRMPDGIAQRSALWRTLIAGRRILLLLDDVVSEEQVRPLLPTHGGAAVLITSRTQLTGLEGRSHLQLDVLDHDAAVSLLGQIVGPARLAAEPAAAAEIVTLCERLPLAVRIAGARLAGRQRWPLAVLATRLRDGHRRLDELVAGDLAVRASLELTYDAMADPLRAAFTALGTLGAAEFGPWVLAALLDVPAAKAEDLAERLTDAQLLDSSGFDADGGPRYRMHDLIRLFARERAEAVVPAAERSTALARVLERMLTLLADDAWPHLDADRQVFVHAVERASGHGLVDLACRLTTALLAPWRVRNSFDEWWRTHDAVLAAARTAGDRRSEATLTLGLGQLRYEQDRLTDAAALYATALALFRTERHEPGQAAALLGLATAHREHGELAAAATALDAATALFTRLADDHGLADCGYGTGYVRRETGDLDGAVAVLTDALARYRDTGNRRGEALTLRSLAITHRAAGDLDTTLRLAHEASAIFAALGDRLLVAYSRQTLAKAHLRRGETGPAAAELADARAVCAEFGDRFGLALVLRTEGELHLVTGDLPAAVRCLAEARDRFAELDFPLFRARTERDLAEAYRRSGADTDAERALTAALDTFAGAGAREYREVALVPAPGAGATIPAAQETRGGPP